MSQLKKRVHVFNCDNTYKLEPVEKLLDQFSVHVEHVEKHSFRLAKMSETVDKIPTLEMDMAFFVVHAHESRLSINEDNAGIGYAKIYRALLQATGKEQKYFHFFILLYQTHLLLLNYTCFRSKVLFRKGSGSLIWSNLLPKLLSI